MAAAIRDGVPGANVDILPGGRGDFLVKADGVVLWDKNGKDGDFPPHERILEQLEQRTS
ncbi:MAG: hypothetical protein KDE27_03795 [Planctomycetes bacterium]|nr:hypothetical protein [Planctomycetota bacterium]